MAAADIAMAVEEWAARIRPHLGQAVESIVAAGEELIAAREAIPHGGWGRLCAEVGLHPRTAHRFMSIARNPVLANRTHASELPPAWTTLYELARLEPEQLEHAIEDGRVTPELGRGQAKNLADRGYRRQLQPAEPAPDDPGPVDRYTCTGCALCGGHVAHYAARRSRPGETRLVYIDAHGVIYEDSAPASEVDELWTLEGLPPHGEAAYVLRRPLASCGAASCGVCELLGLEGVAG